ncbi:Cation efflux system protein CusB precursor [Legionella massiliensis]|uniref:Cation efflux system protein CusB n=1 Tax=Legionella massiliensis TaxID=1034943 RepID=A0A078L2U7_9GAMM|nr:efflux RND transporter periplasmic adaptor subunit [Legionella massiliensis]CDZ79501.1 Cation efflux system protein CusB precursor [Legionella massiliensis]CEE15239.1 Cation efflux system protein CusB precursor [Legionella massiliensis]
MKKYSLFITGFALLLGVIIGYYLSPLAIINNKETTSETTKKKPLYWIDSMEPTIHYSKPGKSRMGMELTPVYAEDTQEQGASTIQISPSLVNNLGVRTAPVIKGSLARRIETVGYVVPNENNISHIHAYANGWVKKLLVKAVGDVVKKGQVVLQLYSPTLVNAQEEYLIALDSKNQTLINASYQKLQTFHIPEQQIAQLKKTRQSSHLIDIYPHQGGVVTMLNVREGMYVTPETEMMSIVDLSNIWMIAEVFEEEANWVKTGEKAQAQLTAFPGTIWKGEVDYIYPEVDLKTRTLKVRFLFDNLEGLLKPNMYASISLVAELKQDVLSIPLEALIRSSEGARVVVSLGKYGFQVRSVTTGIESGDRIEILSGLQVGENVITSGQFLIDSESNLKVGLEHLESSQKSTQQSPSQTQAIEARGIIRSINAKTHIITLQHDAIPKLDWPAMTMDFLVVKTIPISEFKIGDTIEFFLKKENDQFVIIKMKKDKDK